MDYEQKHQEDLEAAKGWLAIAKENDNKIAIQILENLFPELREPEDEKIRKGLIKGLSAMRDIHKHHTFSDDAININDAIAWLEKQVTPQTRTGIEWVNIVDDACDKRYSEEYAHGEYCHEQSFKWGFQEGVDWLEKQGKHKYAWSEEDEDVINHLLDICAGAKKYRQFAGCLQEDITKYQTWLKSIKPNRWNPSKEQLTDLYYAAKQLSETRPNLQILYNDIKQL